MGCKIWNAPGFGQGEVDYILNGKERFIQQKIYIQQ